MDKRYQVFVSSTYDDLKEERAEVMQALLELDCMPAGMELFPAATEEQWSWIKRVIDESDYYVVIVAGRYGSIHEPSGYSYTEKEYRYACEIGKPVIGFLHENAALIPSGKTEANDEGRERLAEFRKFVQSRVCKFYSSPTDLGAKVSRGLTQLIKHHPSPGWVRADKVNPEQSLEVFRLREEVKKLQNTIRQFSDVSSSIEDLEQGEDVFEISYWYETQSFRLNKAGSRYWVKGTEGWGGATLTWNGIIRLLATNLIGASDAGSIIHTLNKWLRHHAEELVAEEHEGHRPSDVRISSKSVTQIKKQLRALGYIEVVTLDGREIWKLTELGDYKITAMFALRRGREQEEVLADWSA